LNEESVVVFPFAKMLWPFERVGVNDFRIR